MTVDQAAIVEAAMLCVSEGRERAEAALRELGGDADAALIEALERAESQLFDIHQRLLQATAFPASTAGQLKLAS